MPQTIEGNHKIRKADTRFEERLSPGERKLARQICRHAQESLKVQMTHSHYWDHGYRAGELHESNLWQIASGIDNARPFSVRETIEVPDFHIGLLVDCSGSMNAYCGSGYAGRSVMSAARSLALGLAEALSGMEGVHVSVCGHTEESGRVHLLMVKRLFSEFNPAHFAQLNARSGNLDGLAVVAFAREMRKEMPPNEVGMLVLISDGAPCHSPIIMKRSFEMAKRNYNFTVFPIGVGSSLARNEEVCKEHYGNGNYIIAEDVLSAMPRIITKANSYIAELKPM